MSLAEPQVSYIVDTDNGLGSKSGDVDDGFALAVMLAAGVPIEAIVPTAGNVSAEESRLNCRSLVRLARLDDALVCSSSEAARRYGTVSGQEKRYIALGPLTSLAERVSESTFTAGISEVVILGGDTKSIGFLQPVWPFEFNLTKDRPAFREVFNSSLLLTFIPVNVARKMRVSWCQVAALEGDLGTYIASGAARWFRRARVYQFAKTVPVWDLVAAAYVLWPELCTVVDRNAYIDWSGRIRWSERARRATKVVGDIEASEMWRRFAGIVGSFRACESKR